MWSICHIPKSCTIAWNQPIDCPCASKSILKGMEHCYYLQLRTYNQTYKIDSWDLYYYSDLTLSRFSARKLRSYWPKVLRQCHVAVVIQGYWWKIVLFPAAYLTGFNSMLNQSSCSEHTWLSLCAWARAWDTMHCYLDECVTRKLSTGCLWNRSSIGLRWIINH